MPTILWLLAAIVNISDQFKKLWRRAGRVFSLCKEPSFRYRISQGERGIFLGKTTMPWLFPPKGKKRLEN